MVEVIISSVAAFIGTDIDDLLVLMFLFSQAAGKKDSLRIVGGRTLAGGLCNGYGDHRMVMSAAVAAFEASGDVMIEGAEAVSKSYPMFFEDLDKIGITVRREKG